MTEAPDSIKPPIEIAAFGTTSHARNTYDFMDHIQEALSVIPISLG